MGAGRGLRGEEVEGERVGGAGGVRVDGRTARVRGGRERRGQVRQGAGGEGFAGLDRGQRGGRGGALAGGTGRVAPGQVGEELLFAAATQQEQDERVLVEQSCRLVAERGRVLAGVTVVRAGAVGDQVADGGQEVGDGGQRVRHVLVEERGHVVGAGGRCVEDALPVVVVKGAQTDLRAVRPGA